MPRTNSSLKKVLLRGVSCGAIFSVAAICTTPGLAQSAPDEDQAYGDQIVVTGSRIARRELTTPNPVTTVDAQEVTLTGSTNVENLLNSLPQVVPGESGFTNNESGGTAQVDLRGLGPQRSLVMVNGRRYIFFDAKQVTDLNTLPAGLVERVELVTGGSSAVYGSDAIGGVVNFILKDDFEGVSLTGQYDVTQHNDADKVNVDFMLGINSADERANVTVYANYFDREAVLAGARDQSECFLVDSTDAAGNPVLECGGSSSIPNGRIAGLPSGAALDARPGVQAELANLGLSGIGGLGFKFDDTGQNVSPFVSPGDQYNFNPLNYLQLPQQRWILGGMGHYDINDRLTIYTEAVFANNRVSTKRAPTPVGGSRLIQVDSPFLAPGVQDLFRALDNSEGSLVLDGNGDPVLGAGGVPVLTPAATRGDGYTTVSIGRRLAEVDTRDVTFERNAYRFVGGLRANIGDLSDSFMRDINFDAYYSYARTRNVTNSTGSTLEDAFDQGITTQFNGSGDLVCVNQANGCAPINIFGQNISPEAVDFITTSQTSSEEAAMEVVSAVFTGELFDAPAGVVGAAAGFEYRAVSALFVPSEGGVGDIGAGPSGGGYDVYELFGEVSVPLLADLPLVESLEINGAFRYSDYSLDKVGGSWTYGGGANWVVFPSVMLRGQYQHAVRAPSVDELFSAQTGSSVAAEDPCATSAGASDPTVRQLCIANGVPPALVGSPGVQPNFQITGVVGGNPDLDQETADTITAGAVLTPFNGFSVTVDYYNIEIEDAISQLGGSVDNVLDICFNQVQDINSPFCQSIVRAGNGVIESPGGVSVLNENIGKIATDGIDANVNYAFDADFGLFDDYSNFSVNFSGTWLHKFDVTSVAELPLLVNNCAGAFGNTCGEPLPKFKSTTRFTWKTGPLTASVRWRWIGRTTDDRIADGAFMPADLAAPYSDSRHYFDLSGSYEISENIEVFGGVLNLLNSEQPLLGNSQEQLNTFPSTYDPLGRRFFIGATARF